MELSEKNIDVPDTMSKLFENPRFKMLTDALPGTGDTNVRGQDSNTNEHMDNVLTRNEYLNDQIIYCF